MLVFVCSRFFVLPVDPTKFSAFLGVMAAMAATPGPANVFAIATGMQRGPKAALIGVAGMNVATLVWFAAAALGLAALVIALPGVFHYVAIAGGLYVAWLGVKALWAGLRGAAAVDLAHAKAATSAFRDGFAVQIANPKAILFFTAVLPPFLDLGRPLWAQLLMLASVTIGMDLIAMSAYGLAGGALSRSLAHAWARRVFSFGVGTLLLLAAVLILVRR